MMSFEDKKKLLVTMESSIAILKVDLKRARLDVDASMEALKTYMEVMNTNCFWGCRALRLPKVYRKGVEKSLKKHKGSKDLTKYADLAKCVDLAKPIIKKLCGFDIKLDACDSSAKEVTEENIDSLLEVADANIKKMDPYLDFLYKRICRCDSDRAVCKSYYCLFERVGRPL